MSMRRQPFFQQHPMMNMLDWSPLSYFGGMNPSFGMFDQFLDPFARLNRIMGRNLGLGGLGGSLGGRNWIGPQQRMQRPKRQQRRRVSSQGPQRQWSQQQQRGVSPRSLSQQRSQPQLRQLSQLRTQPQQKQQRQLTQQQQQWGGQKKIQKQKQPMISQQKGLQQRQPSVLSKMPQKYRITIDCNKLIPKSIKTNLKEVKEKLALVVCAKTKENREFRRQFVLPQNCHHDKMIRCHKPGGIFVVEFPLEEVPMITDIGRKISPEIIKRGREQIVSLNLNIPQTIDLTKVHVFAKERELIIRLEDKPTIGCGDCASKVFFYNRIVLPVNTDHSLLKCVQKKRKLIITAPLLTKTMGGFRCLPIHRKLRHRKTRKVTATATRGITQQKLQKKKVTPTPLKKVPSGVSGGVSGGIKKQKSGTLLGKQAQTGVGIEKQKQKKSTVSGTSGVGIGKGVSGVTSKTKQPELTSTSLSKSKSKSKSSKSKLTGGQHIQSERITSPTSTSSKQRKSGLVSKGSEVLQQIFGSSGKSEELMSGGRKSSSEL